MTTVWSTDDIDRSTFLMSVRPSVVPQPPPTLGLPSWKLAVRRLLVFAVPGSRIPRLPASQSQNFGITKICQNFTFCVLNEAGNNFSRLVNNIFYARQCPIFCCDWNLYFNSHMSLHRPISYAWNKFVGVWRLQNNDQSISLIGKWDPRIPGLQIS